MLSAYAVNISDDRGMLRKAGSKRVNRDFKAPAQPVHLTISQAHEFDNDKSKLD